MNIPLWVILGVTLVFIYLIGDAYLNKQTIKEVEGSNKRLSDLLNTVVLSRRKQVKRAMSWAAECISQNTDMKDRIKFLEKQIQLISFYEKDSPEIIYTLLDFNIVSNLCSVMVKKPGEKEYVEDGWNLQALIEQFRDKYFIPMF